MENTFELFKTGCISKVYNEQYIFTVNPVPRMERIRFTIVKKGTGGKNAVDFWLPFDEFFELIYEVKSAKFEKAIDAERASGAAWPGVYKYVGGEKGCRHMNIGSGKKGVRVQIANNDNRMIVLLTMKDIRTIIRRFEVAVVPEYNNVLQESWKIRKTNNKVPDDIDEDGVVSGPVKTVMDIETILGTHKLIPDVGISYELVGGNRLLFTTEVMNADKVVQAFISKASEKSLKATVAGSFDDGVLTFESFRKS